MKGTVMAVVTGLAVFATAGATGDVLLVERMLIEEATRTLTVEGVDAHAIFSGLIATVSIASLEQSPTALRLVLDVPGVVRAETDRSSLPTTSTSQPAAPIPVLISTPSPEPSPPEPVVSPSSSPSLSPSSASGGILKSVAKLEGGEPDFLSSEHTKIIELAVWLQANPDATVEADRHTGNDCSPAFRKKLSEKRIRRVIDVFVATGANRDQLIAVGKADTEPAESDSTLKGQTESRRVAFVQRGER